MELWLQLLIICPLVFLAGFADSIAGGGGIISLPAYILAGLPIHVAYGTNKFAMCFGTGIATYEYYHSGNIRLKPGLFSVAGALVGSALGAQLVLVLDEKYLQYCLMILLPIVAVLMLINSKLGKTEKPREHKPAVLYLLACLIGLTIGAYDGFFGPGSGMFYILGFSGILGFNLVTSSGNAKLVNLASNIGALTAYVMGGKIMYVIAIPAAICALAGNYVGSRLAIKNGAKIIHPIIIVMMLLLLLKVVIDII